MAGSEEPPPFFHGIFSDDKALHTDDEPIDQLADSVLMQAEDTGTHEFEAIWLRFHAALKKYVRHRLTPGLQGRGQESDIVQSALLSFWKKLEDGRAPATDEDDQLWRYLVTIARRKLSRMWRQVYTKKRGEGKEFTQSDRPNSSLGLDVADFVYAETEVQFQSDLETILSQFDSTTQMVCSMKLAGMTNPEIATELNCSLRRVERKGELLRKVLRDYLETL